MCTCPWAFLRFNILRSLSSPVGPGVLNSLSASALIRKCVSAHASRTSAIRSISVTLVKKRCIHSSPSSSIQSVFWGMAMKSIGQGRRLMNKGSLSNLRNSPRRSSFGAYIVEYEEPFATSSSAFGEDFPYLSNRFSSFSKDRRRGSFPRRIVHRRDIYI